LAGVERLTIDATVAFDYLDPNCERHALAVELFELAERGEVELATAPQGYRLDLSKGAPDAVEQLREAFEREKVGEARQVARVSDVTVIPFVVGHYIKGFAEAWHAIAAGWAKAPGPADQFHVETHLADGRDVFITDDRRLLVMCRRLRDEQEIAVEARSLEEYLARRR
jgi:predicted nucleic acid-binding protein